jgi:hypothetical protein
MTNGQLSSLFWCQAPIWDPKQIFVTVRHLWVCDVGHPLWQVDGNSHSLVWVPRESWPYFTVSDSRLPQPGGPGPHIYIPQERGGPVIPPGTGFPFHHLLRLTGLWWRYSESLYSWRFSANQFVLALSTLRLTTRDFFQTEPLWSIVLM